MFKEDQSIQCAKDYRNWTFMGSKTLLTVQISSKIEFVTNRLNMVYLIHVILVKILWVHWWKEKKGKAHRTILQRQ